MKKYLIALSFLLITAIAEAQNINQIDSLTFKICETLNKSKLTTPQEKLKAALDAHLPVFLTQFEIKSKNDTLFDRIYFRLQKNCKLFIDLTASMEENKSDWVNLKEKPASTIKKADIDKFYKGGHFYYKEYDGKIVDLTITPTSWTEKFEDQTMSKLKFQATGNGQFQLTFIESDNLMRKNLSVKGDSYKYGLFAINDGIYDVWAIDDQGSYTAFKIYPKK